MSSTGQGRLIRSAMVSAQGLRYPVRQETANGGGLDGALGDYWWGGYPPTPTEIPYAWLTPPARWRPAPPANTAAVTRTRGETARSTNRASVEAIGERPYTASLNTTVVDDPANLAAYVTTYYTTPRQRMPEVLLNLVARTPTECWRILERRIGDRISISGAPGSDVQLVANPYFETGVQGWTQSGGVASQSGVWSRSGSKSLLLTPDGVSVNVYAEDDPRPVVPGADYVADGWLYSPAGWSGVGISVHWLTAAGASISFVSANAAIGVGETQHRRTVYTAPANAGLARIHPVIRSTPSVTDVLYADEITLTGPDGSRPVWPDGVTELVIEGIEHTIGSDDARWVRWKTAPVIGSTPGVAGPWFRLGESMTDGTDLLPF